MIYSHKPQRSGRSIPVNTNNPPQDPPPPPINISIKDTTPPVTEPCVEVKPVLTIPKKRISKPKEISLFRRFLARIFRRK